ncbi:hypothetical protein ACFFIF_02040 [Vagococcus entomophilus]|uniref:HTH cro/C1-type domain-containing protein n=1 Tax=Vagococcus entomophilus TaxID=1160095 RepID=A0A430AKQ7_9ENTE|nr:hypothetical protein [Vagococcus entomophilus]RSU08417.1 hypothetical protein CBF30_04040 [Vagococcus entomophilus]RSU08668.1 hypothetical protein CBF30_05430 [Vagococcus entomophilus]
MYWLDKFKEDYNFKSNYVLSKKSGVYESTISMMIKKQTKCENLKFHTALKFAKAASIPVDELEKYFDSEKNTLEKEE